MGLLDRFVARKEPETKVNRLDFSVLPTWVEQRRAKLKEGIPGDFSKEVGDALSRIKDGLDILEKANIEREVEHRITSIVVSSRDNYVSKARKAIGGINPEDDPLKLEGGLKAALGEMQGIDWKYGQRAGFGFSEKISRLKKELNRLVDISNRLSGAVAERKERLKQLSVVEAHMRKVSEAVEGIRILERRKSEDVEELRASKKERAEKEKDIDAIEHSKQAESIAGIELELEYLKNKKQELESSVLNVLGPLKRVFKKYARAVAEGKAGGINVDKYAEDPTGTFLRGENTLPDLLAKMQKAIQTGVVNMKGDEGGKALKKIRAISFSNMDKIRSEYNETISRIRSLEIQAKELSMAKMLERIQREMDALSEKIESIEKRIEKREEELEDKRLELEDMKRALADEVSNFIGGRCEIVGL